MSKGMWESPEAGLKDGQQENCDMMEIDGATEEDGRAEKNFFPVFRHQLHGLLTSFTYILTQFTLLHYIAKVRMGEKSRWKLISPLPLCPTCLPHHFFLVDIIILCRNSVNGSRQIFLVHSWDITLWKFSYGVTIIIITIASTSSSLHKQKWCQAKTDGWETERERGNGKRPVDLDLSDAAVRGRENLGLFFQRIWREGSASVRLLT